MQRLALTLLVSTLLGLSSMVSAETTNTTLAQNTTTGSPPNTTTTPSTTTMPSTTTTPSNDMTTTRTPSAPVSSLDNTLKEADITVLSRQVTGWSAEKHIINQEVVNDQNDKVGKVEDLIIAPDTSLTYAIIGVGGFLGMGKHDVAIPAKYFRIENKKLVLEGATKDLLKQLPEFKYVND